jgi:hypothetical protein
LGVVNWKAKAQKQDGWRKVLEQAKTQKGWSANNNILNLQRIAIVSHSFLFHGGNS